MASDGGFIHMVFFWIDEKAAAEQVAEAAKRYLTAIPEVLRIEVGVPAGTPRAIVDNSYAVALVIEFVDRAAHDIYQERPNHKQFVAEFSHLWHTCRIYDMLVRF